MQIYQNEKSENQRVQFQLGKENQPDSANVPIGDFPCRETIENLLHDGRQVQNRKLSMINRLEMNVQMPLGRKNVVVAKLDEAVEIFAATSCFIMDYIKKVKVHFAVFVLMFVVEAMQARLSRRNAETARQVMVFGAIVELHVPAHRNKQYHQSHQHRPDL